MADKPEDQKPVILKPGEVAVSQDLLTQILEKQATQEQELESIKAKNAGLEELFEADKGVSPTGEKKLREKRSYEPAFRTVRLRKYPVAGNPEKMEYVIGWTDRGAYEKIDRTSGVSPQVVNYIDILFLDQTTMEPRRTPDGKLSAESVPLLDLINGGVPVHCKIIETKKDVRKVPTGEEINVSVWDPAHGLVQTGEIIDGYVGMTDTTYTVQIPGLAKPLTIDQKYVN